MGLFYLIMYGFATASDNNIGITEPSGVKNSTQIVGFSETNLSTALNGESTIGNFIADAMVLILQIFI